MNITFHRLEDERFRPDSELYLESLGIIGSVPAAWLILTLVVLLIYLLTRCCDTKNNKVTSLGDTAEFTEVYVSTNNYKNNTISMSIDIFRYTAAFLVP